MNQASPVKHAVGKESTASRLMPYGGLLLVLMAVVWLYKEYYSVAGASLEKWVGQRVCVYLQARARNIDTVCGVLVGSDRDGLVVRATDDIWTFVPRGFVAYVAYERARSLTEPEAAAGSEAVHDENAK
jgi:hypothetical protein